MDNNINIKKSNRNSGLSLVELIVSIAILSIVGLAIFGFMNTSSRIYSREVSQTDLQYEAQLAVNQIQDMIIDASKGITYKVKAGGTESIVLKDEEAGSSDIEEKNFYITNKDIQYQITWKKAEEKLTYTKYNKGATNWEVDSNADHVPMADYVSEFSADLTNMEKSNSVLFRFLFAVNGVSYSTSSNITLRNKVLVGVDADGDLTEITPVADAIKISPKNIIVWPGDSVYFTHRITSQNGGAPSQEADYTWSGGDSAATVLGSDHVLQVGADETTESPINVTVTAKNSSPEGGGLSLSDTAAVNVKVVTGITVALIPGGSYTGGAEEKLIAGSTLQFTVDSISGSNITYQDLAAGTIEWSVEGDSRYVSISDTGLVMVSLSAPVGTAFKPKAVFTKGSGTPVTGYGVEYKVVALKEYGDIYVDDEKHSYIAPENELWFDETKWIAVRWESIPEQYKKKENGNNLANKYFFQWRVSIDDGAFGALNSGIYYENMFIKPHGSNTSSASLSLDPTQLPGLSSYMKVIKIKLVICEVQEPGAGQDKVVWESKNTIELNFSQVKYKYSYTKGGTYEEYVDDLPILVTNQIGEVYVYYYVCGYLKNDTPEWMGHNYFYVPDKEKFYDFGNWDVKLNIDKNNKVISFKPKAESGSSRIQHSVNIGTWEPTSFTVNFKKPNVYGTAYYVPLKRDAAAFRESGYLFGDCSFTIKTITTVNNKVYYQLNILDERNGKSIKTERYADANSREWQAQNTFYDK